MMTFTLAGEHWQQIRSRMRHLRHDLARVHGAHEWVWCVEHNPAGTGHHVHAWERGGYVPQRLLARLADGAGMGRVTDVRKWDDGPADSVGYGLKNAVAYGLKEATTGDASPYLDLNGGRLTHQSRGFFAGGAVAADRAALAARDDGLGPWAIVAESELSWLRAGGDAFDSHRPYVRGKQRRLTLDGRVESASPRTKETSPILEPRLFDSGTGPA